MSRKFVFALTLLAASSIGAFSHAANLIVTGIVFEDADRDGAFDPDEKALAGVAVSDGKSVTRTDMRGFYEIRTEPGRMVFVSVPGAHHAAGNRFYRSVDNLAGRADFPLVANPDVGDDRFTFVFVTDTHVGHGRNARQGAAKAYNSIAEVNPALVVHGGDIIFDALALSDEEKGREQYDFYTKSLAPIIKSPFYHALGNHDVFGWEREAAKSSPLLW